MQHGIWVWENRVTVANQGLKHPFNRIRRENSGLGLQLSVQLPPGARSPKIKERGKVLYYQVF